MSQSGTDSQGRVDNQGARASAELLQMLAEGRSYSGRERNCCFLNTESDKRSNSRFATISAASGLDFLDDSRGISLVDWDHDGDLDMWVTNRNGPRMRLMINEYASNNGDNIANFVSLELQGNGVSTNRDAVGARVELVTENEGPGKEHRNILTLRAGEGFISQSTKVVTFGLGNEDGVQKILVHWPGQDFATPEEFLIEDINQRYRLVQGTGSATSVDMTRELNLSPSKLDALPRTSDGSVRYQLLLPAPKLEFLSFDKKKITRKNSGKPTFVMLWSSDCDICKAELTELTKRAKEVREAGIDVLALSMDAFSPDGSEKNAKSHIAKLKFPFEVGFATAELVDEFQSLYNHLMPLHSNLPIPCSFLIDEEGRLSAMYKGGVQINQLKQDIHHSKLDMVKRFANSAALPGRTIDDPIVRESLKRQQEANRGVFAREQELAGNLEVALAEYRKLLKYRPDFATARYAIGQTLAKKGKVLEAKQFYADSLKVIPEDARLHTNLANIFVAERNIDEAAKHFELALKYDAESPENYANLGNVLIFKNELARAKQLYEKTIELKPDFADAFHNLGNVEFKLQNFKSAKTNYLKALQLQPEFAEVHLNLGNLLAVEKKYAEAIKSFKEAIRIRPNYPEAKQSMTRALLMQNRGQ